MTVYSERIEFSTRKECEIKDITEDVQKIVSESGIKSGMVCIFAIGSTCAITTMEFEPGLVKDISDALERIAPSNIDYDHNLTWGDGNGRSHVRASLIGPSLVVPFENGKLVLGTWQQVVFIELDIRGRERRVFVQVMGE